MRRVDDEAELHRAYDESGTYLLHLQQAVEPHDLFIRCIGFGPQTRLVRYDPSAPLHDRYTMDDGGVSDEERQTLVDTTLTINSFFGWEFNSCEALRQNGEWRPIDFANACPDSQVTSLHYHFPWLVAANLRWSIFCAATKRPMPVNLDWSPYFEIADSTLPYADKLAAYAAIARQRFQADEFEEFCATHLAHLDDVVWEFFGDGIAYGAVRQKVEALFPATRSTSSPTCSGSASSYGVPRPRRPWLTAPRLAPRRSQQTTTTKDQRDDESKLPTSWYSNRLERDVSVVRWGDYGRPVLVFPTAGGDAEEVERFHLVGACAELLDAGRVKLYSVDSVNGRVDARRRGRRRPPGLGAAAVLRVHRPRAGPGGARRLRIGRHRADRRRRRRSVRSTLSAASACSPTCSAPRSA